MKEGITLGSLFDGSGGFPLGGLLAGIKPVWNSEIEPFPVRVTEKRLPEIQHYGDVSTLNGAELPPVDIITFGSPCQDLSVAGKRNGLDGSRSGLFFHAVRIIKEMRCATNGRYPRFCVWENVPGAFSANGGEDFRSVLEEICKVSDSAVSVPRPAKWSKAGEILADSYSVAWRVLDACGWGVPQRRKRIYLVADFAGQCAGKILFESEGLSGYSPQGFRAWQGTAGGAENSTGTTGCAELMFSNHGQETRFKSPISVAETVSTTYSREGRNVPCPLTYGICGKYSNSMMSDNPYSGFYHAETSRTLDTSDQSPTKNQGGMAVIQHAYATSKSFFHIGIAENIAEALVATDYKDPPTVFSSPYYIVRRLTPTECARLQGFPDWWCSDLGSENPTEEEIDRWAEIFETHRRITAPDTKPKSRNVVIKWLKNPNSDSAEYKMWGNGVALPCVYFVLSGIAYYAQSAVE